MRRNRTSHEKLITAAKCSNIKAVKKHIEAGGLEFDFGGAALGYAVFNFYFEMVKLLVENGSNINYLALERAKTNPAMYQYLVNAERKRKLSRIDETA